MEKDGYTITRFAKWSGTWPFRYRVTRNGGYPTNCIIANTVTLRGARSAARKDARDYSPTVVEIYKP